MDRENKLSNKKRIVVKVGSSSLSFSNGRINLQRMELLASVLTKIRNEGKNLILVSSGAVAVGGGITGAKKKPGNLAEKQALAAIGQAELLKIYQKFFMQHGQLVAQVLLTKDGCTNPMRRINAYNTLNALLKMNIIAIINENDTVSTRGIEFGNNDVLSASVAELIEADLLIMLSDIDGLYSADPRRVKDARLIPSVTHISPELEKSAGGSENSFGTGGMTTKIDAIKKCFEAGIDVILANGKDPEIIYDLIKGKELGTYFEADNN